MKLAPMRFMGYTWLNNPKSIDVSNGKKVVHIGVPYGDDISQFFGEKIAVISGVGELYGTDCLKQYEKLYDIYTKGESGILCLPQLKPVRACFEKLRVVADDIPNVIRYEFRFSTLPNDDEHVACNSVHIVKNGESLWDIASEYGVDVYTLCELNRDIMFINEPQEGTRVRLC